MQFGFYIPCYWPDTTYPAHRLYEDAVEQAKQAEECGFLSATIPEHHFINYLTHPNPLLTAIKVVENTRHLRVMIAIHVLPFHDMRLLAGEIAQADCLSRGRIEYGVGRGAFACEFDRLNLSIADSLDQFVDGLQLLEKLLTEEEVSWKSRWYDFPPLTIMPRPYTQPRPVIWVAAVQPAAIASTVRHGFPVMTTPLRGGFEWAKAQAEAFTAAVREEGQKAAHLRLSMLRMAYVAKDEADKREKVRIALENHRRFTNIYTGAGLVDRGVVRAVDVPETEDDIERALLIGSAQEVADKMEAYRSMGVHDLQVNGSFGASHADVMGAIERFSAGVMPHFAERAA